MTVTQPIRNKSQVRLLAAYYLELGNLRNYALIILCLYTALRSCDILRLLWDDVFDFESGSVKSSIYILETKTGKSKIVALNRCAVTALNLYAAGNARRGGFIFVNSRTLKAISRIQAYRIIHAAGVALGFDVGISCHSLRKTFGYHAWRGGAKPVVLMEIYNHSSYDVTKRYLGITQDDKNAVYLGLSFFECVGDTGSS